MAILTSQWSVLWHSFRVQLTLWFGCLSLVSLLAAGIYVGRIATDELAGQAVYSLQTQAQSAATLLAQNLRERQQEISFLAKIPLMQRAELDSVDVRNVLALHQSSRREYAWIGVADQGGVVRQAVNGLLVGQKVNTRPWFVAAQNGSYTGDVHEAKPLAKELQPKTSTEPLRFVDFAAPIYDLSGRLRGVLGSHAHWNWVTSIIEDALKQGDKAKQPEALITDKYGRVLYPQHLVGNLRLPAQPLRGSKPALARQWDDGQRYVSAIAPVIAGVPERLGWQIVLRQPEDVALAPVRALKLRLWMLGGLIAALFAGCAYWLATRLSRPIEHLATAVQAIEAKRQMLDLPANQFTNEMRQLSRAIGSMAKNLLLREQELQQLNISLEAQVAERTKALHDANVELELLATTDALTGLLNRRRFDEKLHECFLALPRVGRHFAVLMLDIDHFKRVNDVHGHPVGDSVLKEIAKVIAQNIRSTDTVARFGGEEFSVLLPAITHDQESMVVAEKIRAAVQSHIFTGVDGVTVSIGISLSAYNDIAAPEVIRRADVALYKAKAQGRNQVVRVLAAA